MQRSKASASVEVKQVILALCKLLSAAGLGSVPKPETFRRAKFGGGPDVEEDLWELLANILEKTDSVSLALSKHPKTDRQTLVSAALWRAGFYADWMCGGEERAGPFSSRDLLLALAWLVAQGALEKLLSRRVEELDKTLLTSAAAKSESAGVPGDLRLDSDSLRRLLWRLGSLRHQGRVLLCMREERARSLHKILNMDLPPHEGAVSSDEGSAAIKKDCACLQELCDLLEAYLKWKQAEGLFWTWMDSVVDGHRADLVARKPAREPESGSVGLRGNRGSETPEGTLQARPNNSRLDAKPDAAEGAEGGVDPSFLFLHPEPSLPRVYRPKLLRAGTKAGPGFPLEVSAAEVSRLLAQTEAELLKKRDRLRRANRATLEGMVEELDGLVLIPP